MAGTAFTGTPHGVSAKHAKRKLCSQAAQSRRAVLRAAAAVPICSGAAAAAAEVPPDKPVVVILRCAEVTAIQEGLLRDLANGKRSDFAVGPNQMKLSVEIFLKNSKLEQQYELPCSTSALLSGAGPGGTPSSPSARCRKSR
eukprot:EG_transcript_10687